jgi:predicted nucleotidyltransferase
LTNQPFSAIDRFVVTPKDKKLDEIVRVLKNEFNPSRLFLFGSRATGNARLDSDYDFVLVVPENTKARWENLEKARHLLHENCNPRFEKFKGAY